MVRHCARKLPKRTNPPKENASETAHKTAIGIAVSLDAQCARIARRGELRAGHPCRRLRLGTYRGIFSGVGQHADTPAAVIADTPRYADYIGSVHLRHQRAAVLGGRLGAARFYRGQFLAWRFGRGALQYFFLGAVFSGRTINEAT